MWVAGPGIAAIRTSGQFGSRRRLEGLQSGGLGSAGGGWALQRGLRTGAGVPGSAAHGVCLVQTVAMSSPRSQMNVGQLTLGTLSSRPCVDP